MKNYIFRLRQGCKAHTFIFWWIMRLIISAALVAEVLSGSFTPTGIIHIAACLAGTFLWELSLATPKKSLFRLIPSSIHTVINIGLTASAFLGIYLEFYYSRQFFDPLLQAFFSFTAVLYGYEIAYAMIKRESFPSTKAMVFFVAFGVSFICFNAWELGEFFTDQLVGHLTGEAGNAQFWSQTLALGTGRAESLIPPLVPGRMALMDIMADVIIHSLSSFAALIFINLFPYRMRGRHSYNASLTVKAASLKENTDI